MALDRERLRKPVKKLRKLLKKFSKQPDQGEVHDLRTNTRQLEVLLNALQLDSRGNEKKLLQTLATIRKKAGKVRDMDVLTQFASTLHAGEEEDCRVALIEHLGAKRYRQASKLGRLVQSERRPIRKRLKRSAARVDKALGNPKQPGYDGQAGAEAAALSMRLAAELRDRPRLDSGNLHDYRKKVKELRYVLKFAENSDSDLIATLGDVKDAIGEWHDWVELGAIAEKALDHGSRCGLLHEIHAIGKTKFDHALSLANQMRAQYLGVSSRKERGRIRQRGTGPITKPVLAATASIAA